MAASDPESGIASVVLNYAYVNPAGALVKASVNMSESGSLFTAAIDAKQLQAQPGRIAMTVTAQNGAGLTATSGTASVAVVACQ